MYKYIHITKAGIVTFILNEKRSSVEMFMFSELILGITMKKDLMLTKDPLVSRSALRALPTLFHFILKTT